jgi:hypothetical protein
MLFLIAEHVDSEGEAVGGVQGRRPGLDHRSRLHSSLPSRFSDEDFVVWMWYCDWRNGEFQFN